jgi:hypothetical protein
MLKYVNLYGNNNNNNNNKNNNLKCEVADSHSNVAEDPGLPRCDAVSFWQMVPIALRENSAFILNGLAIPEDQNHQ